MTDRYHSLTVVLDHDIRDDDAEALMNAIRMLRSVAVVTGVVVDATSYMAEMRAKQDLTNKIFGVLK